MNSFTRPGFACWVMRLTDWISTSRQPRFSHADQWKKHWASFYGNQPAFLSPVRLPVCSQHVLAHRMNFHHVKTEKHERSISSTAVSSLQWWSWITWLLSQWRVLLHLTHLLRLLRLAGAFVLDASTDLVAKLEIKTPPKNIWRRLCGVDAEYTEGSNSTNVMSWESFLVPPLQVFTIKPMWV